jgi:hypothetical protein
MMPRNERPPTAGNGKGPESATTVNRCSANSSTIIFLKRDRCGVSVQDVVCEGVTE